MNKRLITISIALVMGVLNMSAQSPLAELAKKAASSKDEKKDSTSAPAGKKKYSDIITKDAQSVNGLMSIHKVKSTYYLEIPFEQMGKPMLLSSKVSETSDNSDVIAGQMPTDPLMVEWSCDDDNVYLLLADRMAICDSTEAISSGVAINYIKPVMKAFPIKANNADSTSVVFDATKFFCSDEKYLSPFMPASPLDAIFGSRKKSGSFKADLSSVLSFKAFPENILVKSRMSYSVSGEPFTAIMTLSMIALPEEPMMPRFSDIRLGYFSDSRLRYSENKDRSVMEKYITRWRIQPKPEDMDKYFRGELVEPEKPIVYYLDSAFPEKWRRYLKEGIEDWQMAFEAIGFKNAIVARDYPVDDPTFDPDDIRYSCIRYSATRVENAMGPSWTDPRTGEILQGSVYFYHDVLKLLHNWAFIQLSTVEPATRKEVFDVETMGPFLRYLIVHEVGHTLGLMHNMRGSYAYPVESLRDPEFTAEYGTTASIMDYARYNYVAQPGDGVKWLLPPRLGLYDKFAIAWGYKPIQGAKTPQDELPTLNKWLLEKDDDPIYQYGEQEFLTSIDPASQTESLGDDAVKASEYGIRNLKIIAENLVDWTAKDGTDYRYTREMYVEILKQFNRYMGHVAKYIGGNFIQNAVHGDGKKGYIPVDREKQKEALNFVFNNVRGLSDWMLDPKVIGQFEPGNDQIYDYQGAYVKSLLSAASKVTYTSKMAENPYTQYEYLHDVYNLVFAKSMARKKLDRSDMVMEYSFLYSVLEMLDMLNGSAKKVAVADLDSMFTEDLLPCSFYGLSEYEHNHEHELASAKKESDIKITGKAIYFDLLRDMQKLMESRSKSSNGEMKSHYSYLAFEIDQVMKQL